MLSAIGPARPAPPNHTHTTTRNNAPPTEPPLQTDPAGPTRSRGGAFQSASDAFLRGRWGLLNPGGRFFYYSTPHGASAVGTPEQHGHATNAWGTVVGTHPRQMPSRGPRCSPFIPCSNAPHPAAIYPGTFRDFLVVWGLCPHTTCGVWAGGHNSYLGSILAEG